MANTTSTPVTVTTTLELLAAKLQRDFTDQATVALTTPAGSNDTPRIDIRPRTNNGGDFLRITKADLTFRLYELTEHEVLLGEATFSGSLAGGVHGAVRDYLAAN